MRTFFLLLVALNVAFLAWMRYGGSSESTTDSQPLGRQVSPEKIRIVAAPEGVKPPAVPPVPAAPAAQKPPAAAEAATCIEWGGFATTESPKAEQALQPLALGPRLAQNRTEETAGWWVYIPPQGNRAAAVKKTAELKALGIGEFFILQDEGPTQWAVSLGVFSAEEAAKNRLEALRAKGVRTAQIGPRDTRVTKVWFQVRNAEPALQDKLKDVAKGFPGTELRNCS